MNINKSHAIHIKYKRYSTQTLTSHMRYTVNIKDITHKH